MKEILSRRSVREYLDKEISEDQIKSILHAGMSAPSAGNQQPWHFIVIKNQQKLEALTQVSPYAKMLKNAKAAILVCGDLNKQKHEGYWMIDCAAATENMLLEITHIELGAVWLGVYPRSERMEFLKKYFNLPEKIEAFALLSIGYPKTNAKELNRFDNERVHLEEW